MSGLTRAIAVPLALAAVGTVGPGLVAMTLPAGGRRAARAGLVVCAGLTIGLGLWSAVGVVLMLLGSHDPRGLLAGDAVLAAVGVALVARAATAGPSTPAPEVRRRPGSSAYLRRRRPLPLLLALAVVSCAVTFILQTVRFPDGGWDAWSIWNVRARFLFAGSARAFDPVLSHADYPPLLPMGIARLQWLLGEPSQAVPAVAAATAAALCAGVLLFAATWVGGRSAGLWSAIVLLGTPEFINHASDQYADVPVACLFLTACALVAIAVREGGPRPLLAVAGAAAGLAALTKNEGCVQFVGLAAGLAVAAIWHRGSDRRLGRATAWFVAGALVPLVVLVAFKLRFAGANDMVTGRPAFAVGRLMPVGGPAAVAPVPLGRRLTDVHRYWTVGGSIVARLFKVDRWNLFLPASVVALVVLPGRRRPAAACLAVALLIVTAAMAAAYVATPHDLTWHLNTSLDRLILQSWPTALLLVGLRLAPPGDDDRFGCLPPARPL